MVCICENINNNLENKLDGMKLYLCNSLVVLYKLYVLL